MMTEAAPAAWTGISTDRELFTDPNFVPSPRPTLEVAPFTLDELIDGRRRLPLTKALDPNGLPTII